MSKAVAAKAVGGYIGIFFAFLSAGLFALLNVVLRFASPYLSVWQIMFGRCLLGALLMILITRGINSWLLGQDRRTMLLVGITGGGGIICIMGAILLLPLFEALCLIYLYPVFAAILSPILTEDRTELRDWLLITAAFCGTLCILWAGDVNFSLQVGHLLALSAAFSYGLSITLIRRVSGTNSPFTPFFYFCLAGMVIGGLPVLLQDSSLEISLRGMGFLLGISLIGASGQLAAIKALEYLPSTKVGVIGMSELIFGGILGLWIFSEPVTLLDSLGGTVIIASCLLLNFKPRKIAQ
ncbi:DMT family transporter [Desulforhopalus singaporensis]|uniref:Threonine/homoserine efflux transporter RhtA n=1 Tax=Desulforhopalus singaporensis TaxID=91360 RepID=A0A1H0LU16_9BACT|nr:DMT family transporter [Desulforhopalus singaporensis]SDO71476.1 Threonine/homoserine efflux transporter RhtA [Desulforhopalus singaporensis]